MSTLADGDRDLLRKARVANLIKTWTTGSRRLTTEELAEIEKFHPGLVQPPASHETPAAPAFSLTGNAPPPAKIRDFYARRLADYAVPYGYAPTNGERSIKRLVSKGRHAQPLDLPPLDEASKMPAWWRRHYPGRKVPDGIRRAASRVGGEIEEAAPREPSPPPASAAEVTTEPTTPPVPASSAQPARDFPAQVEALRSIVDDHLAQLRAVTDEQLPARISDEIDRVEWARSKSERIDAAQRNYKGSLESLRKAENDLVAWQQAHGELVNRTAVALEMGRAMRAVHTAVKRMLRAVRPKLEGKLQAEQDRIWDEETRAAFRALKDTGFAELAAP